MSEFEQKYTFSGVGVFEVTIPFPYASPSEVTVFYSGDAGIYEGTLAGLIQSGIATRVEGATYRLHFDEGQTVHTVFGRRTILKAEIQTLLRAVEDLRAEMLGAFRVPDACFETLKTFPAKLRAKKAVLMDCCGQLSVGDFPGTAEIDAAKQQVEDAANRSSLLLNEATERLESAISAYRKIESLCNAFPREAEAANAKLQEVVGGALSEFRRVVNNAEALFGQQSEQAVSRLSAEVEKYSAFAEKQRELFAVALESAVKCLNEASDSGIDSIEDREDEALRALDAELEHALTVIRECIRAYGLKLRELTDKLISELRSCYSEEWAKSAQKYALDAQASARSAEKTYESFLSDLEVWRTQAGELGRSLAEEVDARTKADEALSSRLSDLGKQIADNYVSISLLQGGFDTQTIFGFDPMTETQTGNNIYLGGDQLTFTSGGAEILVPKVAGTLALAADLAAETSTRNQQYDYLNTRITTFGTEVQTNRDYIVTLNNNLNALNTAMQSSFNSVASDIEALQTGKADASALSEKCSLLSNVAGTANNNANGYGYVGTLRNLGAWGGAVNVEKLSFWRRSNSGGTTGTVYARILKASADGTAWIVASQSTNAVDTSTVAFSGEIAFQMASVAGVVPPSANERIAIVFVTDSSAEAGSSVGALGFRTVDGAGALANALPSTPPLPSGQASYRPMIGLKFAAMNSPTAEVDAYTKAEMDTLLGNIVSSCNTAIATKADRTTVSALTTRVEANENALGGNKIVTLTQDEYDALATKDTNTLYFIKAS